MKLKRFFKNMKTQWVLVLLLCTSIAFSKTILANSKFAKSIVNSLTAGTKSKTPKAVKTSVAFAPDTDLDGITDDLDLDDDNDGILDTVECPATDIVTNGTFTTNLTGWTAGTGWAFSSGTATNTSDFTTSSLSQSLTNLDKVPNNTVSLTVKIGAQDAGNSAGNTSSLDIMLGGVVYATLSNSVLRNTSNVTISLAPGVTSNFVTFGTSSITGFTTSTFTINIPYSGPSSSTLAFRMNSGGDDWSVDDVSISALICDIDGDGIPNYLDLDSDGDGCPDAVEGGGGFTNANLVTATGSLATQSPNKNLGNTVGANGVPTIAGAGQNIGVSQNSNVNACTDSDGDGIANVSDLDNDNDGILDVNEKVCPLTGQTIRIGYIPNSRDLDGDTGYTFDGSLMSGSGALKLTNPANFGTNGTVNANIVLINMGTAPITKAIINSLNLNAIFLGGINDAAATPNSYLSAAEFNAIKDWSDDSQNNYVVSTQAQTQPWGTSVVSQISNPNVPTSYGSQTSIFKGPFGKVTSFTQGGGYQGYFSSITALFGANALAVNGSNGPVMYVDGIYNDLMIADVDILTTTGGITSGSSVTSNNDILFMNIWAFVAEQSACTSYKDTDGDGIPDYLDLDSDADGCPDAVEGGGGFSNANLVTATGSLATQNPNKNLGNNVGSNGVPTIAGAGQNIGVSQNSNVNACTDSDGDGVTDVSDLDSDNDGILDVNEKTCPLTGQTIRIGYIPDSRSGNNGYTFDGTQMSASGALKLTNPANFGPNGAVNANIVLVNMGTAPITKAIINSLNLNAIFLGGIDNGTTSYLSVAEFNAIKDWSDDSQNNYVVSTQIQTQPWGTSVVSQVSNPNVPTSYGSQTSIFKGPFGKVTSFNQAGGYQGYFSSINALFGANALAVNGSNGPVMYVDGIYNDLMIADVDILTALGGVTAGSGVSSDNDILFMNIWAFVAEQSACTSYKDTDGDGIPDYLDLDSDADGCPDAVEGGGGFTNANLVTATGSLATQNPNQNLGNNVGSNGVPTIAGAGQNIGVSQNSNVNACTDSDGDGITNVYDLDNDNDGILDVNEKICPLTGQTIRIGYIPDSRSGNNGYTFNGSQMSGSGALKLTNPANFGPSGTVKANIVLVNMGTAPITKAIINSLNLNAIFLGGIDNGTTSYLSAGEFKAIKDWSDDSQNNYVVSTQIQTQFWDTSVVSQVSNPNVPTSYGSQTSIFKGPFGTVTSFNQAGGYQGYFSAINSSFGTNALAVNGSNGPVMYVDGIYNDLMIADVDILTALGGVTAGSGVTSNNDKLFMNIWAFVAEQSVCTSYKDTDGDGIPDYLDLDSDGDSCPDAIEGGGGFTSANLVTATGSLATQNPNQNLGNNVGSNGVPTIAGAGQSVNNSTNALVNLCYCYKTPASPGGGNPNPVKYGITPLNRAGSGSSEWPGVRRSAWAALEAKSKGFVVNRMAFVDADSNPATPTTPPLASIPAANYVEGMMVYDTVANCLKIYNGTVWSCYSTQTCPD
ncbi:DUF11 domain-containing protein [Chryseobacterium sp. IT-36CA2]